MDRIILRHSKGSKANQAEEFDLSSFQGLTLGRDLASNVRFDSEVDALVSRQHARIERDASDPTQFTITDLNSTNGTYVNGQRTVGPTRIGPGSKIQFGPDGPMFEFDLDPRPVRATVLATPAIRATTESPAITGIPVVTEAQAGHGPTHAVVEQAPGGVGRDTVERLVARKEDETRRRFSLAIAIVVVLLGLLVGGFVYMNNRSNEQIRKQMASVQNKADRLQGQMPQQQDNATMTPAQIFAEHSAGVVRVEIGWNLVCQGQPVYQMYTSDGLPMYEKVGAKTEPVLTLDSGGKNREIGDRGVGSGFVVKPPYSTDSGFILTNAHVAAPWQAWYSLPAPGVLVKRTRNHLRIIDAVTEAPIDWVPDNAAVVQGPIKNKTLTGHLDYLDVVLPKTTDRIHAESVKVSSENDVALLKISYPGPLHELETYDNYDSIRAGDAAVTIGYFEVIPVVKGTSPHGLFNRERVLETVAAPTLSSGNVQRVVHESEKNEVFSPLIHDTYQLTINSQGPGGSGGPVFDDHGRVIGIFAASTTKGDASVSFAVPILYGEKLMDANKVTR